MSIYIHYNTIWEWKNLHLGSPEETYCIGVQSPFVRG